MKKMRKILLATITMMPLLALADQNPCSQFTGDEAANCQIIYADLNKTKSDFINAHQYTPPSQSSKPTASTPTPPQVMTMPQLPSSPANTYITPSQPASQPASTQPVTHNIYQ